MKLRETDHGYVIESDGNIRSFFFSELDLKELYELLHEKFKNQDS